MRRLPELLWSDPLGSVLDVPALLSSWLPGRSWLPLARTRRGLDELARAMADIHRSRVADADLGERDGFAGRALGALPTSSAAYGRWAGGAGDELRELAWFGLVAAARCWDQYEQWLPAYHAFGVPDLIVETMRQRLLTFTLAASG